jgi:hypothetical protein
MTMTTGYPGKQSTEEARKEHAPKAQVPKMKKNTTQETNSHPTQITITNIFEALRPEKTEGNTNHERKDPTPPPIFVPGIANVQRLTATIEKVINRLKYEYTLKIINDIIKTKKVEYRKTIIYILKEKKIEFYTFQPRQQRAYKVVIRNLHHSARQEIVREDIERMVHKIRNLWNIRDRVCGNPLSLFFLDIEPAANNSEIYNVEYLQNMRVQIESPNQKQNNIPQCKKEMPSVLPYQGELFKQTKMHEMWHIT